jgi:hypothetical protein
MIIDGLFRMSMVEMLIFLFQKRIPAVLQFVNAILFYP